MSRNVIQTYTCENGELARFSIPETATEDDLEGLVEFLAVVMRRRFKVEKGGDNDQRRSNQPTRLAQVQDE